MGYKTISPEELRKLVLQEMSKIDDTRLYYELRAKKVRRMLDLTTLKCCIALHRLGLPITVGLVSYILGQHESSVRTKLHVLGDKHLLVLKRESGIFEWTLSPLAQTLNV